MTNTPPTTASDGAYQPGDVVLTAYGTGVIVGATAGHFSVRLWRLIGKSISSAALAILNPSAVSETDAIWSGDRETSSYVYIFC